VAAAAAAARQAAAVAAAAGQLDGADAERADALSRIRATALSAAAAASGGTSSFTTRFQRSPNPQPGPGPGSYDPRPAQKVPRGPRGPDVRPITAPAATGDTVDSSLPSATPRSACSQPRAPSPVFGSSAPRGDARHGRDHVPGPGAYNLAVPPARSVTVDTAPRLSPPRSAAGSAPPAGGSPNRASLVASTGNGFGWGSRFPAPSQRSPGPGRYDAAGLADEVAARTANGSRLGSFAGSSGRGGRSVDPGGRSPIAASAATIGVGASIGSTVLQHQVLVERGGGAAEPSIGGGRLRAQAWSEECQQRHQRWACSPSSVGGEVSATCANDEVDRPR